MEIVLYAWALLVLVLVYCIHSIRFGGRLRFKASCEQLGISAEAELDTAALPKDDGSVP
jgi:hypothetical protein